MSGAKISLLLLECVGGEPWLLLLDRRWISLERQGYLASPLLIYSIRQERFFLAGCHIFVYFLCSGVDLIFLTSLVSSRMCDTENNSLVHTSEHIRGVLIDSRQTR